MAGKTVQVRMPDGTIRKVRVPDKKFSAEAKSAPGAVATAVRALMQGLTFGFHDELTGAASAGLKALGMDKNLSGAPTGYKAARDRMRATNKAAQQANPGTWLASELAGAIPASAVPIAGAVGRGVTLGKSLPKLAGIGAGEGALYGLGTSASGDLKEQALDALKSGAISGAAAPVLPGLLTGARLSAHKLFPALGKDAPKRFMAEYLDETGLTAADVAKRTAGNPNMMPADAANELRQALGMITGRSVSPGRRTAASGALERLGKQKQAATDALVGKKTAGAEAVLENFKAKLAGPRRKAYAKAYESSLPVGGDRRYHKLMERPAVRKALKDSMRLFSTRKGALDLDGDQMPVEVLDKVSGILGDSAASARLARKGTEAHAYDKAKAAWDGWLKDVAPKSLFKGRRLAQREFQFEEALRAGQDYGKASKQTVVNNLVEFKKQPELLRAYRHGVIDSTMKKLERVQPSQSFKKAFTPGERERLKMVLGDKHYNRFWSAVEDERSIQRTAQMLDRDPNVGSGIKLGDLPVHPMFWQYRLAQKGYKSFTKPSAQRAEGELIDMLTRPGGLKGVPSLEKIKGLGRTRHLAGPAAVLPHTGGQ